MFPKTQKHFDIGRKFSRRPSGGERRLAVLTATKHTSTICALVGTLGLMWTVAIRPRNGSCLCSPAASLCTRHVWLAERGGAVESAAGGCRRWRRPPPRVATSWQNRGWLGRSSCCRQGNGRWMSERRAPARTKHRGVNPTDDRVNKQLLLL